MPLLEVEGLHKHFGGLHATNDVSFTLEAGAIQAVIGPNGAGKTTLFNLVSGSLPPSAGRVLFEGRDITGLKPFQIARLGIIRTFQNLKLSRHMSVLENVMLGRHIRSRAGFLSSMLSLPAVWREEREIRRQAMAALERLGIAALHDREAGTLPFGQQRAVELARALACEPKLLLLDEPASGLNIQETAELAGLIRAIRDQGVTILIVEHDMSLVMDISDHIVVLNFGRKIAQGAPEAIQRNPEVIQIYLGEEDA
jgi:branched-chain amino acid transport system ATP-binding protein